jgi:hypothetical protein
MSENLDPAGPSATDSALLDCEARAVPGPATLPGARARGEAHACNDGARSPPMCAPQVEYGHWPAGPQC